MLFYQKKKKLGMSKLLIKIKFKKPATYYN